MAHAHAHADNLVTRDATVDAGAASRLAVPVGRALFAAIFIFAGLGHFSAQTIGFAAQQGVPLANLAVPLSGILSMAGGLSVALGYRARWGALALIAFLVPVTLMMHNFWAVTDPMMKQMHMAMFMKNVALIGGALLVSWFGAGPYSLDNRLAR
jgi:putative oxidoreductase